MAINTWNTSDLRVFTEWGNGTFGLNYGTQTNFASTGQWRHLVYTIDKSGSSTVSKIYYNGVLANTSITDQTSGNNGNLMTDFATSGQTTNIGAFADGTWRFKGLMDDFRIYNKILTEQEVQNIAAQ